MNPKTLLAVMSAFVAANPALTMFASNDVKRAFGVLPPSTRKRKHYNKPLTGLTPEMSAHNKAIDEKRKARLEAKRAKREAKEQP